MDEAEAVKVLASADRQLLLHELVRANGKMTVRGLARQVAARRHQLPASKISENDIDRAHVRLRHVHLPLLRDLELVEWDDGTVTLADDDCRDQLFETAELLEEWPPDDHLRHPSL